MYCVPDRDVKTITINNPAMMLNQGHYSLDFSDIYPDLEEIEINFNFDFDTKFFNQFNGDLGLSNNMNLKSIKGKDHFLKIVMCAELPQLTSLEMHFSNKNYKWDWLSKFDSLKMLKVYYNGHFSVTNLIFNVSNCKNIEEFSLSCGYYWLNKTQEDLIISMSHLKKLRLYVSAMSFDYWNTTSSYEAFKVKFMDTNPHVQAEISFYRIPFSME